MISVIMTKKRDKNDDDEWKRKDWVHTCKQWTAFNIQIKFSELIAQMIVRINRAAAADEIIIIMIIIIINLKRAKE